MNQFIKDLGESFGSSVKINPKDRTPPNVTLIIPDLLVREKLSFILEISRLPFMWKPSKPPETGDRSSL